MSAPRTPQTEQYVATEADKFFRRNGVKRGFLVEYLLSLLPRAEIVNFDVAEFGIGGGQNLMLLKNFVNCCHGYDGSNDAIECFKGWYSASPEASKFYCQRVNLCAAFRTPQQYDLIIYGFFTYYASDQELLAAKENLLRALKPGGLLFFYDFIARSCTEYPDAHNSQITVYKRNVPFWIEHFSEFDLLDLRVFDNAKYLSAKLRPEQHSVDLSLPKDDMQWNVGALFRHRG